MDLSWKSEGFFYLFLGRVEEKWKKLLCEKEKKEEKWCWKNEKSNNLRLSAGQKRAGNYKLGNRFERKEK